MTSALFVILLSVLKIVQNYQQMNQAHSKLGKFLFYDNDPDQTEAVCKWINHWKYSKMILTTTYHNDLKYLLRLLEGRMELRPS